MAKEAEFTCEVCGARFWRIPCYVARSRRNGRIVTCQRGCSNRLFKRLCVGSLNPAWKGGVDSVTRECPTCKQPFQGKGCIERVYCSRPCYHAALSLGGFEVRPRNKPKYRRIMEIILGRKLTPKEVVHHKDGDCSNNSPDNLQVMTRAEHTRLHISMRNLVRKGVK